MAVQLILKNSAVQDKEATAAQLAAGEIALNYHSSGPFLQCEDTAGNVWRLGGVVIASTAPSSPSKGAWWLDSDDNHLYFYNGSSWIEIQTGEIVPGDIAEGTARQLLQTNAAGNGTEWTSNIDVPGTLDVTGVATFDNNVVITGNLTVNGTTTTIDTTTLVVEDKNIELGVVGTPTDTTADGGGITVKGATDKTLTWVNSTGAWTSNQPLDVNGEVECDGIANGTSSVSVANNGNITVTRGGTVMGTFGASGLVFDDNIKLRLGGAADLEIYHDGSNSIIDDTGTGNLIVKGANVQLNSDVVSIKNNANNEDLAKFNANGAVQLFHDNSEKLNTTSTGINVTGTVTCDGITVEGDQLLIDGNPKISLKDSNNTGTGAVTLMEFMDSASDIQGQFGFTSNANSNLVIANNESGQIRFATNASTRFYIDADGHLIPNDDNTYDIGSSTNEWRNAYFDGVVNCDQLDVDGTIDIAGDASFFGNVDLQDSDQLRLGSGDDLRLYHDGAASAIDNNTGHLYISNYADDRDITIRSDNGAGGITNYIVCDGSNGSVKLYDYGNQKLTTSGSGIDVTGTVNCDGMTSDNSITVNSGFGTVFIRDNNSSGTASQAQVAFRDSGSTDLGQIGYLDSANSSIYIKNSISGYGVIFGTNNTARCQVNADGHFVPNTDDTYDIGTSSLQWRDAFFDGTVNCDGAAINGKCTSEEQTATASAFNLANGNFWTFGAIAVPNPTNQAAGLMGSLRVTAAPTSFASNWKFPGGTYTAPTSFPAVAPFFVQASGTILVGSWTEGIA